MNHRFLEQFLRAVELGSINKAAVDLRLSQPALSRNISLLEHEVGTTLLVRTRSGVKLTEPGRLLYEQSRPLLRQFAILKEQVGQTARGQVAIGFPPSWHGFLTIGFAARFLREHPDIRIRITEAVSHVLREQLVNGLIDICIAPHEPAGGDACHQTPLMRESIVFVGPPGANLDPARPVQIDCLSGLPLVIASRPNQIRVKIEHEMAMRDLDLQVAIETDTMALCLELAAKGLGHTVVPQGALLNPVGQMERCWAPIDAIFIDWAMLVNSRRTHSQAVRSCRNLLVQMVQTAVRAGGHSHALPPAASLTGPQS